MKEQSAQKQNEANENEKKALWKWNYCTGVWDSEWERERTTLEEDWNQVKRQNFNNNIEKHVREPNARRIMLFINHKIFGSLLVYIGYVQMMWCCCCCWWWCCLIFAAASVERSERVMWSLYFVVLSYSHFCFIYSILRFTNSEVNARPMFVYIRVCASVCECVLFSFHLLAVAASAFSSSLCVCVCVSFQCTIFLRAILLSRTRIRCAV